MVLLKLPKNYYKNQPGPPTKPKKMPDGEVCKINSDCKSNKCLGGFCCNKKMKDKFCTRCNSFLFNNMSDNPPGMCNFCVKGFKKEKDRNQLCQPNEGWNINNTAKCECIDKKSNGGYCNDWNKNNKPWCYTSDNCGNKKGKKRWQY